MIILKGTVTCFSARPARLTCPFDSKITPPDLLETPTNLNPAPSTVFLQHDRMQHQSCPFSHSSSRCTGPLSNLRPNTPVFAFNVGFCDPDPNEIDPLDFSYLSNDTHTWANGLDDSMLPTQSPAIVRSPFERQRYFVASHSSKNTPPLSGYTKTLSTSGSTPSLALLWTPGSPHMHDFRHSHPLRDKRSHKPITQVVF